MVYRSLGKRAISSILAMAFIVSGCLSSDVPTASQGFGTVTTPPTTTSGGASGGVLETALAPTVEIRHLIEPNFSTDPTYSSGTGYGGGGSYVRKLTLPKNFAGHLYLAGINISSLSGRHIKVRFKFGLDADPIYVPAVVTTAPGITPATSIQVLVMDLRAQPFRPVRLPYDLYDYNEYGVDETPVQDNRNTELYCRGLKVQDDPTFNGVNRCDGLEDGEECLYAYAKVTDQGLVKQVYNGTSTVLVPIEPTLTQAKTTIGGDYYADDVTRTLMRPLHDLQTSPMKFNNDVNFKLNNTPTVDWTFKEILGEKYYYRGPYKLDNRANWEFDFANLIGSKRLFKSSIPYNYVGPADSLAPTPYGSTVYFGSYKFPLATQINLASNVPHMSSNDWRDPRSLTGSSIAGKTLWMDGSNARAQSRNSLLETVASCNVTATIDIMAKDDNLNEYVVATSKEVKLQLVRPTEYYTDTGTDVLYSNYKTCTSNASCGGTECCFNKRCWDQRLVSQCLDTANPQGNYQIGQACTSDLECTSLCCNRGTGLCAPHNTVLSPAVLCSKPIGDFCIAKEWCQKTPVVKCLIVKDANDPVTGAVRCRQQCYNVEEYGDCKAGTCVAPFQASIPTFDPTAAGACNNAVPAPNF